MSNPIQTNNLNINEVTVVLPDGTTVYGPVQSVIDVIKGIKVPANVDRVVPVAPKQTENRTSTLNVFSKADRKRLSVYHKYDFERFEQFMADNAYLLNWKDQVVPKMHTIYGVDPDTLPIRGKKFCYIDCYGNVFSCLDAVAEYYHVKSIGEAPKMTFEWYAKTNADKIRIPEFNDDEDAYIFWHLNFKDSNGEKVSIVKTYRCNIYEWEKHIDDPAVAYSRKLNQFSDFLINVMHAKAHMND